MPLALRHHIHDDEHVPVLIDLARRQLAAQDLGEDVLLVIGRGAHP
jgi:hypothetical protein